MKEESHNPSTGPELEARIVALVLGEASDFERGELNRLIEKRPELAALKEQLQSVHGLLQEVGTGESLQDDDDWKLSAEKRSAVLAVIGGDAEKQLAKQALNKLAKKRQSVKWNSLWNLTKIAAVFCFVGLAGSMAMLAFFNYGSTDSSRFRQLASNVVRQRDASASLDDGVNSDDSRHASEFLLGEAFAPSKESVLKGNSKITAATEDRFQKAMPETVADFDYGRISKSSLSAIRDSLDADATLPRSYYLMDEAQQSSAGPEYKSRQEAAAREARENGRESSQQTADNRVLSSNNEAEWSGELGEDANRPTDAPPNAPMGDSGELSFPTFAFAEPMGSTISVPARGTILLGGIKRPAEGVASGGETRDAAKKRKTVSGLDDGLPELGRESVGSGVVTIDEIEEGRAENRRFVPQQGIVSGLSGGASSKLESADKLSSFKRFGDESTFSLGQSFQSGGTNIEFPNDLEDSLPSGEDKYINGIVADGEVLGGDVLMDSSGKETPANREGGGFFYREPVAGTTAINQPRNEADAGQAKQENQWGYEESKGYSVGERDFGTNPSVGFSVDATDQPSTLEGRETPQGIEQRAKNSLGEISALNNFSRNTDITEHVLPDDNGNNVDQYWSRPQSEPKNKRGELPRRGGQLAIAGENQRHRYDPPVSEDNFESMKKLAVKKSAATEGLNEKTAEDEAFSTFSLHVGDVSFKLARAALAHGEWPEAAKVRIEEFVNAFDYGDPLPRQSERVSCRLEQSIHPFLQQRNLLRVSMRTAAAGRASNTPLRLTFVLDNSGSMERIDRQQTVRRAFALLAQQLKPIDQVTLISFARQPRLLADKVGGAQSRQLVELIHDLPSEGGTNIEAALQLAIEKAREQRVDDAQNRIVLLTDGAVNLGDANPDSLSKMITTMRNAGIAFDAAGISAEGLNDEILEALTRKGDGRYYLLDFPEAADDGFARQIAGALRPSAKNVKVQIEFNPKRVGRYKLLGFEKHRLKQEDFRNDKVDAAEMAAAEAGVAVYQFEAKPDGEGDVGLVSVRFRDLSTGQMIENCWPIPYEADAPRPDQAAPSLRIATSAALLAAKLRGEPLGESVDLKALSNLIAGLPDQDRNVDRVQQLQLMIQQARQVSGKIGSSTVIKQLQTVRNFI